MKVAVSSRGQDLNSPIDPRFGRCAYFLVVETDDMSFKVFDNQSAALGGGAGIQSAQFVVSKGARAVITGSCGPNAVKAFSAAGTDVYLGNSGTVQDAVQKLKNGELPGPAKADVPEPIRPAGESGMGRGGGSRGGIGMGGRGRGSGGGIGMGRGQGRSGGR
jgi:predicted Fe-Mo cluster-binding NifX family protein